MRDEMIGEEFRFYVAMWKSRNLKVMLVDRNDGEGVWDIYRDPGDWAHGRLCYALCRTTADPPVILRYQEPIGLWSDIEIIGPMSRPELQEGAVENVIEGAFNAMFSGPGSEQDSYED